MGGFLSGVLGTNSQVGVDSQSPMQALGPWMDQNQNLANLINSQAQGNGAVQQVMQQGANQVAQQTAAQNAANRAINPALAARLSNQTAVGLGGQAMQQGTQAQLGSQQLLGSVLAQQQHNVNQAQAVNAGIASGNQQQAGAIVGGIMSGAGAAMGMAHGGMVPHMSAGGLMGNLMDDSSDDSGPQSGVGRFLSSAGGSMGAQSNGQQNPLTKGFSSLGGGLGKMLKPSGSSPLQMPSLGASAGLGGGAPSLGVGTLSAAPIAAPTAGMAVPAANLAMPAMQAVGPAALALKSGGDVPGKAKVKGDSKKNDTVPAMLSPGEIVIPRHITEDKDAPKKAAAFVAAVLAKKGRMK